MSEMSAETIRHALETARRNGFRVVRIAEGDAKFRATLSEMDWSVEPEAATPEMAVIQEEVSNGIKDVGAPQVGYFHVGKSRIQVGDKIELGQVVGEIHALGIANDVTAAVAGEVVEIVASEGDAVEFGQALLKVKA